MKYLVTAAALVKVALSNTEGASETQSEASSGGKNAESRMGYYYGLNHLAYPGDYGDMSYSNGRYCYGGSSLSGDLGLCDYPNPALSYSGRPYYGKPLYGNPVYGNPALRNPRYGNPVYGNPVYGRAAVLG